MVQQTANRRQNPYANAYSGAVDGTTALAGSPISNPAPMAPRHYPGPMQQPLPQQRAQHRPMPPPQQQRPPQQQQGAPMMQQQRRRSQYQAVVQQQAAPQSMSRRAQAEQQPHTQRQQQPPQQPPTQPPQQQSRQVRKTRRRLVLPRYVCVAVVSVMLVTMFASFSEQNGRMAMLERDIGHQETELISAEARIAELDSHLALIDDEVRMRALALNRLGMQVPTQDQVRRIPLPYVIEVGGEVAQEQETPKNIIHLFLALFQKD